MNGRLNTKTALEGIRPGHRLLLGKGTGLTGFLVRVIKNDKKLKMVKISVPRYQLDSKSSPSNRGT